MQMKENLREPQAVERVMARIQKLSPNSKGHWGKMNVTEMLMHCSLALSFVIQDRSPYTKPTLKNCLVKFIVLNVLSVFPRNHRSPGRVQTVGKTHVDEFETQKGYFIKTLEEFYRHKDPLTSIHPSMGFLSVDEWGKVAWMHMDHHLRQFGV